jgi:hypothetical protein
MATTINNPLKCFLLVTDNLYENIYPIAAADPNVSPLLLPVVVEVVVGVVVGPVVVVVLPPLGFT